MSTATLDVGNAIKMVEEAVERIVNDAEQTFPEAACIGDAVRQGDIYIQLLGPVSEPAFYTKLNNPQFPIQLAPGNTKGSRHMLEFSEGIEVYKCDVAEMLEAEEAGDTERQWELNDKFREKMANYAMTITGENAETANKWQSASNAVAIEAGAALSLCGPIFVLQKRGKVSHPEHGDWILPAGTYRVTFQRTLDSENRVRRVFD
jgi:hypothetical protein